MNLRKLEVFVAVVEAGSFSRGAEIASLTQSTVSQHIAALEEEAGLRLLDRTGQGVLLTQAGERFLKHARQVLAECAALRQAMAEVHGLTHAGLTVGASNIPANYLIPALLPSLAERYPGIALTMQAGDSRDMLDLLLADVVELVVVGSRTDHRDVEFLPLTKDLLVLAVNSSHPWSGRAAITLAELTAGPIVVRERGSGSDQALCLALRQAGCDPDRLLVAARLGSNEAVRQAVIGGFGVAFLSEISIRKELQLGELVKVPVSGFTVQRQFWLATKSRRTLSPAARVFAALVQEGFPALQTAPPI